MKNVFTIISLGIMSLFLTGCGIPHGDSIEDCRTMSQCYYHDKSVRSEGSDMSNDLIPLLLNEEDDIVFYYGRNPGGEHVDFIYISSDHMSEENINVIADVLLEIKDVVSNHYDFDDIETLITFKNTELNIYFDDNDKINFISVTVDKSTYTNVDDYTEEDIINELEENAEKVKLLLDYSDSTYIRWFGIGKINVITEDGETKVTVSADVDSQAVRTKIEELLEDYEFIFPDY